MNGQEGFLVIYSKLTPQLMLYSLEKYLLEPGAKTNMHFHIHLLLYI